jgi:hypothetical protein
MLKRELPDFRTVERWAMGLLLEAGAIHKCDQHGWAKDRTDPHARDEALQTAREETARRTVAQGGGRGRAWSVGIGRRHLSRVRLIHLVQAREPGPGSPIESPLV